MDREDKIFVQVVGSKALRTLKTRNIRLFNAFKERCKENGENPEKVLGRILLKFVNSVLDGDEFHEELLDKTINVSLLSRRKDMFENLKEIVEMKKLLSETESDEIDSLIKHLITKEIERASASPVDLLSQQQQQPQQIVIDENLLYQLDPASLDALAKMAEKVKMEKVKAMQVDSSRVEEVVDSGREEEVSEEEKEVEAGGLDKGVNGSGEGGEELSGSDVEPDIDVEQEVPAERTD